MSDYKPVHDRPYALIIGIDSYSIPRFPTKDGNRDIFVINACGSDLTSSQVDDYAPAWSPDGTWIAFPSLRMGNWDTFISDLQGNFRQMTINNPDATNPTWSPDSSRIVFVSNRSGDKQLWMMDLKGENLVQLTNGFKSAEGASWLN